MHKRGKCKRGGERDRSMRERWAGGWCGVCECVYVAFWHFSGETVYTFQKTLRRICKPQNRGCVFLFPARLLPTTKGRSRFGNRNTHPQVQEALKLCRRAVSRSFLCMSHCVAALFIWKITSTSILLKGCGKTSLKFSASETHFL